MVKRVVIAGCRDYDNYREAKAYIDFCICNLRQNYELVIVSGHCRGADMLGEKNAQENQFPIEYCPAEWEKYGKYAGPKRNEKMAEIGDYVICFWDGKSRGTKSMIEVAKRMGKPVKIKKI